MNLAIYGILIILALFIILMVFNPNLSCFGRKLKSPLYPVMRQRKQKMMKTVEYGFDLDGSGEKRAHGTERVRVSPQGSAPSKQRVVAEDYGFDLSGRSEEKKED